MQDEVNEKTVSLCIRCGKVTANLLKAAMKKALVKMEQEKQKLKGQKQPKQDKEDKTYKGSSPMPDMPFWMHSTQRNRRHLPPRLQHLKRLSEIMRSMRNPQTALSL